MPVALDAPISRPTSRKGNPVEGYTGRGGSVDLGRFLLRKAFFPLALGPFARRAHHLSGASAGPALRLLLDLPAGAARGTTDPSAGAGAAGEPSAALALVALDLELDLLAQGDLGDVAAALALGAGERARAGAGAARERSRPGAGAAVGGDLDHS